MTSRTRRREDKHLSASAQPSVGHPPAGKGNCERPLRPGTAMSSKYLLNRIRHNFYFAWAARKILRPVHRVCGSVAKQIKRKMWINGSPVIYDGIPIRFPRDVGVAFNSKIFWDGAYERPTWETLKALLPNATHFIDVGSNIGLFAVMAKKLEPELRVDAFEPVPSLYEKNLAFHRVNGISEDQVHQLALGNLDGEAALLLPQEEELVEEASAGTLRQDSWQAEKTFTREVPVKVIKLDSFLQTLALRQPLVWKIDTEDFEASVLEGAAETIKKMRPRIICEILPRRHGNKETLKLLDDYSYVAFALTECGLFRVQQQDFVANRSFSNFLLLGSEEALAGRNYVSYGDLPTFFESVELFDS